MYTRSTQNQWQFLLLLLLLQVDGLNGPEAVFEQTHELN
jgi:hypothetical protein